MKKIYLNKIITISLLFVISTVANPAPEKRVQVAKFSNNELNDWKNKSFKGQTNYSIQTENQQTSLHAKSMQSASALYKKIKIDIHHTPYLNWSWRVNKALPSLDEQTKIGDDYAARIYVVFKTGITPLNTKALNYIWSSNKNTPSSWPNAYTENAIMIPLRSMLDSTNTWYQEKVNIKTDLSKHFKKIPRYISGVAIMTDTDNSKYTASANYGDIYFSSH